MYTACWFTKLPPGFVKVGISRGTPKNMIGAPVVRQLFPGPWFHSVGVEEYRDRYRAQLEKLNAAQVVETIDRLVPAGHVPALCCWERAGKPDEWCHRAYVSDWLCHELGLVVEEYGVPGLYATRHPLLPAQFREPDPIPVAAPGTRPRPDRRKP